MPSLYCNLQQKSTFRDLKPNPVNSETQLQESLPTGEEKKMDLIGIGLGLPCEWENSAFPSHPGFSSTPPPPKLVEPLL